MKHGKTAFLLVLLAASAALDLRAEPLAWIRLGDPGGQRHKDTPYHWLGDAPLHLEVDVVPAKGHALDLLWGAKGDQRGAQITVNGKAQLLQAGGYDGFQWQRIALPGDVEGKRYRVDLRAARPKAAFFAGVRVVKADVQLDLPLPKAQAKGIKISEPPPHELAQWTDALQNDGLDAWQRAAIHGRQANEALRRCRKYVDGWLAHADPKTGLIPRNLGSGKHFWNGRDSGADNYAFMVLTCALTDRGMFDGRMLDMLRTETRLTSRIGALPADYDFKKQGFRHEKPDIDRLIFDGSEYVKDGLMPITEWLGRSPWCDRMIAIVDSIVENALFDTPFGRLPSNNVEVNGEMMQVLGRLRFMTGDKKYLDTACRIADYYLLGDHHPTRDFSNLSLDDHACELISGLTEVYAACHALRPDKAKQYRGPVHAMLDRVLEVGADEYGLLYERVDPRSGKVLRDHRTDNWGYNYNAFHTVYLLDRADRYRAATVKAMRNLKAHYMKYPWEGWGSDGIADSVEGAINLYNREPDVAGVAEWIDTNMARMLLIQKPDGVIEGWHGDGNYARTAILWVLWKQQGATVQPWRTDVRLGAVRDGDTLYLALQADQPWQGKLIFDQPRHRNVMKMPLDYPRINQFPEWFTAEATGRYAIDMNGEKQTRQGREMIKGLPLTLRVGEQMRLVVR